MEGLEPEPDVNQDLSSAQWQAPPYLGWGCVPNCWSRSPVRHVQLTPFPLSVCSPPPQHWHPCPREEQCWSKSSWLIRVLIMSWSIDNSLMFPAPVSLRLLPICCLPRLQQWPSLPCLDVFPGLSSSIPQNHIPPWAMTALTLVWRCA